MSQKTLLILDTGIVGIITNPKSSSPEVQNCKQWFKQSLNQGVSFILPEIAEFFNLNTSAGVVKTAKIFWRKSSLITFPGVFINRVSLSDY